MGRLRLDLPTALGRDHAGYPRDGQVRCRGDEVDRATARFLRWFDCWAGR